MEQKLEDREYISQKTASHIFGVSESTLKKLRRNRKLDEGIHWVYMGKKVFYCLPLLSDWFRNQNDPVAHQRAVEAYSRKLLSNVKKSATSKRGNSPTSPTSK